VIEPGYFFELPIFLFCLFMLHEITGMNPKASFGKRFRSKLRGIIPSAARDYSTYQFRPGVPLAFKLAAQFLF